jgi:hypothetical protein
LGALRLAGSRAAAGAAVVLALVGLGEAVARAQGLAPASAPAAVVVVPPDCLSAAPNARDALVAILTAELRADGVDRVLLVPGPDKDRPLAVITLRASPCEPTAREVLVTIEDHATSKKVERRVPLADVDDAARPRVLALAVAELLRATWLELTLREAPPPEVPVPDTVRSAMVRQVAAALGPALGAGTPREVVAEPPSKLPAPSLAVASRVFPSTQTVLFGGDAAGTMPVLAPGLAARLDGRVLVGTAHDPLGDVNLGLATVGGALMLASPREATVWAAVGPHVELGVAWASGSPLDQATESRRGAGFVSTASLLGAFYVRITRQWDLALELEGGATVASFEARADTRRVTSVDGAMFGVALGLFKR